MQKEQVVQVVRESLRGSRKVKIVFRRSEVRRGIYYALCPLKNSDKILFLDEGDFKLILNRLAIQIAYMTDWEDESNRTLIFNFTDTFNEKDEGLPAFDRLCEFVEKIEVVR